MKNRANTRTASNYECLSVRRNVLYAFSYGNMEQSVQEWTK